MTVHERAALGRGTPGVVFSHPQTDPVQPARERKTREGTSAMTLDLYEPVPTHRPPPALLEEQGNLQVRVERLLKRLRPKVPYQYLVKWYTYP